MRKFLFNIVLLLLSTVIGLVVVEMGLRVLYPQTLSRSYKTRDGLIILRPNHKGISTSATNRFEYRINSLGMRDREHQIEKGANTFRVMILGDSFMEALQVDFNHVFAKLLEDKLNAGLTKPQSIEVINVAVSGWGTDEQLTYLTRYGLSLKPDLVLVAMTLNNDVYDNLEENFHVLSGERLVAKPAAVIPFVEYAIWRLKSYVGAHSHTYQLARLWWHAGNMEADRQGLSAHVVDLIQNAPTPQLTKGWMLTRALLKEIRATARQANAETAVFLIPLAIQIEDEERSRFITQYHLPKELAALYGPQAIMKSFGEAEKFEVIDLLPFLKEWKAKHRAALYRKDDLHWTERGHEVAANAIASEIISRGLLDPQRRAAAGSSR